MLAIRPLSIDFETCRPYAAVGAWAGLVLAGHLLGAALVAGDPLVRIGAPPLAGGFDLRIGLALLPALALGAAAIAWAPALARRLRWRSLLVAAWAGSLAWAVALAGSGGLGALTAPLATRYEYLSAVPRVAELGGFLASFTDVLASYPTHVKGHPPGMVVLLWLLDQAGLGGARPATALVLCAGAVVAPAALVALRAVASEDAARRAAPLLVFAPAAVWMATSADALFAGVAAAGIACFAVAASRGSVALGATAGAVLGAGLLLSYGLAPLGVVVLAIGVGLRAWRVLVAAAGAVLAVLVVTAAGTGFWWPEGLRATRELYLGGVSQRRPHDQFLVINLAAFALAVGPAAALALARLRDRGVWLLTGGVLGALAAAQASGLSKGEVERIWLPFVPWVLVACAVLGAPRRWLAAQVALALIVQAVVLSPW